MHGKGLGNDAIMFVGCGFEERKVFGLRRMILGAIEGRGGGIGDRIGE